MRRVIVIAFNGAQTLDVTGPAEVFASAQRLHGYPYNVVLASAARPWAATTSATLKTTPLERLRPSPHDTVLVAGGGDVAVRAAMADERLLRWVRQAYGKVERLGSVCSGAFILGNAGLLEGRRAATHWSSVEQLRALCPQTQVDGEAIYVHDGVWTSAGVTTGIDMALAMLEADHGARAASLVASDLVLYMRRPGFQSQFSEVQVAQRERSAPFTDVIEAIRRAPRKASIARLSKVVGLSERSFHRRCLEATGVTPGRLIQKLRVEAARTRLLSTQSALKTISYECGFPSLAAMTATFRRQLGLDPKQVRLLHAR